MTILAPFIYWVNDAEKLFTYQKHEQLFFFSSICTDSSNIKPGWSWWMQRVTSNLTFHLVSYKSTKRKMAITFSLSASFKLATLSCILLCAVTGAMPIECPGSGESGIPEASPDVTTCSYSSNLNELFVGLQVLQKYGLLKHDFSLVSTHTRTEFNRIHTSQSIVMIINLIAWLIIFWLILQFVLAL